MEIPSSFKRRLEEFNRSTGVPLHLEWDRRGKLIQRAGWYPTPPDGWAWKDEKYEPRWMIWVKVVESNHPLRKSVKYPPHMMKVVDGDPYVRLCPWESGDGSFADPFSEIFFKAARKAFVARPTRHSGALGHFHDMYGTDSQVEDAHTSRLVKALVDRMGGAQEYYRRYPNPLISLNPDIRTKADWRWRLR